MPTDAAGDLGPDDELSPCGLVRVHWSIGTGLMSHEIHSPRFVDARTGLTFLSLLDEQWDGAVSWLGAGRFTLRLRNYLRPGALAATIDLPAGRYRIEGGEGDGAEGDGDQPLAGIDRGIRKAFAKASAAAARAERAARPLADRPPVWTWLAIAVAMLAACYLLFG